uniref:Tumor necrosis factor receptor superfamily member 10A-like n=1 Tax=Sus scrofa TaxID=9823 RepID=A0A8D1IWR0_PIG
MNFPVGIPLKAKRGVPHHYSQPLGILWGFTHQILSPFPGYHVSEDGKNCTSCIHGVDFTIYWNVLPSCLPCTTCKSGEEEKTPCTATADTRCECKPGTFREENSPEFCQKSHTRCPDGMVMATPCTPSSDLKCMDQESGNSELVVGIAVPCSILLLAVVIACLVCKCKVQGCGLHRKFMDKVSWFLQDLVASGPQQRLPTHPRAPGGHSAQFVLCYGPWLCQVGWGLWADCRGAIGLLRAALRPVGRATAVLLSACKTPSPPNPRWTLGLGVVQQGC